MTNSTNLVLSDIRKKLFEMQDKDYRNFHSALMPTVNKELVIGVRTPLLRYFAKNMKGSRERELFLQALPHKYYEENNLHAFFIEQEKDIDNCIALLDEFLPYVDNWATCDMMNPKVLLKEKEKLIETIKKWLTSPHTYVIRFGLKMLMTGFLGDDFSEEYLELAASVHSEEYYVNMMIAWFFATALTKQYDSALKFIEQKKLSPFCRNKAISKACDSFLVPKERKLQLKAMRCKYQS